MHRVELHPDASEEVEEAFSWYEREASVVLANSFLNELDRGLSIIRDAPHRWPKYLQDTRRFVLRRFPFSVIYRFDDEVVRVVAVAHQRRKPGYWRVRKW